MNEAEAADRLAEMRQLRPAGLSSVLFTIEHHGRRQATRRFQGQLWVAGSIDEVRARVRFGESETASSQDVILVVGTRPQVWLWENVGQEAVSAVDKLFEPVVDGTDLLFFDLLNPWFFWEELVYIGSKRSSGSPVHLFEAIPPESYRDGLAGIGVARLQIGVDSRFNAPVLVEYLNADGEVRRTLEVRRVRRVGEQWIVRTVEVIDQNSRSRTQFHISRAALDIPLQGGAIFSPDTLGVDPGFPGDGAFEQL